MCGLNATLLKPLRFTWALVPVNIHTLQQRKQTMAKFVYKQTQTFYLHIDADTQEEADAIAENTETYADDVSATELTGWELDWVEAE